MSARNTTEYPDTRHTAAVPRMLLQYNQYRVFHTGATRTHEFVGHVTEILLVLAPLGHDLVDARLELIEALELAARLDVRFAHARDGDVEELAAVRALVVSDGARQLRAVEVQVEVAQLTQQLLRLPRVLLRVAHLSKPHVHVHVYDTCSSAATLC